MSYGDSLQSQSRDQTTCDVAFEVADSLVDVLTHYGITILLSTYQADKLVALSSVNGKLEIEFHNYDRPMGTAVDQSLDRLAVATRDSILVARNERDVARRLPNPRGSCFLTRLAHFTGDIQTHQVEWAGNELWFVNTRFSCLCTLDERMPSHSHRAYGFNLPAREGAHQIAESFANAAVHWRKHHRGLGIEISK